MDNDNLIVTCFFAFAVLILGVIYMADYQGKSYRANCIVAMKDRPATDILAVCK